ncbi:hypothetical protein TNCV_1255101 [Trichonephila clavipes]|nr:hypothetical protein TNCV_1255101 [Trichonephila clavipes]
MATGSFVTQNYSRSQNVAEMIAVSHLDLRDVLPHEKHAQKQSTVLFYRNHSGSIGVQPLGTCSSDFVSTVTPLQLDCVAFTRVSERSKYSIADPTDLEVEVNEKVRKKRRFIIRLFCDEFPQRAVNNGSLHQRHLSLKRNVGFTGMKNV